MSRPTRSTRSSTLPTVFPASRSTAALAKRKAAQLDDGEIVLPKIEVVEEQAVVGVKEELEEQQARGGGSIVFEHELGGHGHPMNLLALPHPAPPSTPTKKRKLVMVEVPSSPSSSIKLPVSESKPKRTPKKKHSHGETPFPDLLSPTAEQCQEVADLLTALHGLPERDEVITPSLTVAGCGEVNSVLDATLRTLLSAATTTENAGRALKGIVSHYGVMTEGVGKGSPDWDKVREGTTQELFDAIRCGGLAGGKSKNIKAILEIVWQENQEMAKVGEVKEETGEVKVEVDEVKMEQSAVDGTTMDHPSASSSTLTPKTEPPTTPTILSLDHLHNLPTPEALDRLTSLPGIGLKTAACVAMFCMRRPVFAVDTHVWRMAKSLGWVPESASRDDAFRHLDKRIPGELKYVLHCLFWKHGRYCEKCQLIVVAPKEGRPSLIGVPCVIEHLLDRSRGENKKKKSLLLLGVKKEGGSPSPRKRAAAGKSPKKGKGKWSESEDEAEAESSGSEWGSPSPKKKAVGKSPKGKLVKSGKGRGDEDDGGSGSEWDGRD